MLPLVIILIIVGIYLYTRVPVPSDLNPAAAAEYKKIYALYGKHTSSGSNNYGWENKGPFAFIIVYGAKKNGDIVDVSIPWLDYKVGSGKYVKNIVKARDELKVYGLVKDSAVRDRKEIIGVASPSFLESMQRLIAVDHMYMERQLSIRTDNLDWNIQTIYGMGKI